MSDGNNGGATPNGIGADTAININVKHILMALGALASIGWGMTKYFYEQTHKDIDEVRDEVKKLEDKVDDLEKRVNTNEVKISTWEAKKDAAKRLAVATGMDRDKIEDIVGVKPPRGTAQSSRGGASGPFANRVGGASGTGGARNDDGDNDGVPNGFDQCPGEREVWNGFQDQDGCPDDLPQAVAHVAEDLPDSFPDYDADGIPDYEDVYPDPELAYGSAEVHLANTKKADRLWRRELRKAKRAKKKQKRKCKRDHTKCREWIKPGDDMLTASDVLADIQTRESLLY